MNRANNFYTISWIEHPKLNPPSPPFSKVGTTLNRGGMGEFVLFLLPDHLEGIQSVWAKWNIM